MRLTKLQLENKEKLKLKLLNFFVGVLAVSYYFKKFSERGFILFKIISYDNLVFSLITHIIYVGIISNSDKLERAESTKLYKGDKGR